MASLLKELGHRTKGLIFMCTKALYVNNICTLIELQLLLLDVEKTTHSLVIQVYLS